MSKKETSFEGSVVPTPPETEPLYYAPPVFIPQHLEVEGRPDLEVFPAGIAFGSGLPFGEEYGVEGYRVISFYEPVIASHLDRPDGPKLRYVNRGSDADIVDIQYDPVSGGYRAIKIVAGKIYRRVEGSDWDSFFQDLTGPGIAPGEEYGLHKLGESASV